MASQEKLSYGEKTLSRGVKFHSLGPRHSLVCPEAQVIFPHMSLLCDTKYKEAPPLGMTGGLKYQSVAMSLVGMWPRKGF